MKFKWIYYIPLRINRSLKKFSVKSRKVIGKWCSNHLYKCNLHKLPLNYKVASELLLILYIQYGSPLSIIMIQVNCVLFTAGTKKGKIVVWAHERLWEDKHGLKSIYLSSIIYAPGQNIYNFPYISMRLIMSEVALEIKQP